MADTQLPPLILCMENATGEDVALRIEPDDDFQSFLVKAKSLLGFDVDINSITRNQPVSLEENMYQFLINAEQNLHTDPELAAQSYEQILEPANDTNDLVYILDDGTQINASQIHFDNEDPPVDLTAEKIPFVKYTDDATEDVELENLGVEDTKRFNIVESPISRWSSKNSSPKCSFVNSLPFRLVCNNTSGFEAQFTKYLESSAKMYASLNPVINRNKSPRSLIRDNYKNYDENLQSSRNSDDFTTFTREEILNMFKDSPVASLPYDNNLSFEKRRHVRKTDPSRPVHKNWNTKPVSYVNDDGTIIGQTESQNCFICGKYVDNNLEKLYLFDNEDQKLHRSSPQKKLSTQLKIICEQCLDENFKPCRMKSPHQSLNPDEYLVIRNNQQYIFQKTNSFNYKKVQSGNFVNLGEAKAIIDKIESEILKQGGQDKEKVEFVKVEIGSDGEIITKSIDNELRSSDDVIIVKDEKEDCSSDVEIVEPDPEIDDNLIDNLEDADEGVKEFLGKYQCDSNVELKELKCRFCERVFTDLIEVVDHGEEHKHALEDGEVYPCPLCDYGYANFKWLKGHLKAAHDKSEKGKEETKNENDAKKDEMSSPNQSSPIATRTRSSNKKLENENRKGNTKNILENAEEPTEGKKNEDSVMESADMNSVRTIKTEVKQECLDTSEEEEIWIVQTADDEDTAKQLQQLLHTAKGSDNIQDGTFSKTYKCSHCSQIFLSSDGLAAHKCRRRGRKRKSLTKDETIICVPTEEDFIKRAQGRPRHVEESGDNDLLVVRSRKKNSELTSDPQIVTCHNCNESFTSKVRLKFHMQFHESNNMLTSDGRYTCPECDKATFATETELFDHVHFQHDKQKRWQCPVKECGKTFYLRATLTKHSRTHTDTRRYVCVTCGKRFLDKQTLDEHGVTHLQIKPFQCHICMKQLTRRSRLRMHLRAHEEELSPKLVLVCAVCSRAFRDHVDAQDHASRSTECIEAFANELKEETEEATVQLSPTSGLVRHTVQIVESPRLSEPLKRQVEGGAAGALLAALADEARAIVRVVEIEKAFRCEYCEDVFYLEDGLNNHRSIHKGVKNPFTCHICKVSFATYSRCTTHKTTHGFYKRSLAEAKKQAGEGSNRSQQAGPSATGILGYGGFPVAKHFLCEDCGRSYLHWTYLQVHRRMKHANENFLYKCNQCEMTFPNSWSVAYHRKKIHGKSGQDNGSGTTKVIREDYRIPCRDCTEVLPNKTALYKHRKKEHSDMSARITGKQGAFWCDTCGKRYCSRGGLEAHARAHAAPAAPACAKCGDSFAHLNALHEHLKEAHGDDVEFACASCGETFHTRGELAAHTRAHAAHTPHASHRGHGHGCAVCGRVFRTASTRNEHMRTHTGERPYPCDLCGVAFRRSTAMRNHRLIHTGVRAWACARCPKRFRVRSDLRTHLRLKHPARLAVIEIEGLNPTSEEVMEHLTLNNIPHDKVIEVTKISFAKGSSSVVPSCSRALALLPAPAPAPAPARLPLAGPHRAHAHAHHRTVEEFQPARRGRGIAKNPRRPKILQRGGDDIPQQDPNVYPTALEVATEELTDLNVQLLLRDGALVNGNQMVRLQLDDPMLLQ